MEEAVFAPLCILVSFVNNKVPMRAPYAANACTAAQPWVVGPADRSYQLARVAQPENTYTVNGFTVRSKCVVWSSLRNTWSKCEILEITEEATKVLDLSNGIEEVVNPEMSETVCPNWIRVHLRKEAWR